MENERGCLVGQGRAEYELCPNTQGGFYGGLVDEMPRPPLMPSGTLDQSCCSQIREP